MKNDFESTIFFIDEGAGDSSLRRTGFKSACSRFESWIFDRFHNKFDTFSYEAVAPMS